MLKKNEKFRIDNETLLRETIVGKNLISTFRIVKTEKRDNYKKSYLF